MPTLASGKFDQRHALVEIISKYGARRYSKSKQNAAIDE